MFVPSLFSPLLVVFGTALLATRRLARLGLFAIVAGTLLFFLLGSGWTATWLLGRLEYRHAPTQDEATAQARAMVVLAGFARADDGVPITGQLNRASAVRLLEATRLLAKHSLPTYVSGHGDVPELMAAALRSVAGSVAMITIDRKARSTYESALNLKAELGQQPFFLVTSAGHMPRALAVFQATGMQPLPAPTDYLSQRNWYQASWLPSGSYLAMSDLAIHEYVGMVWYRMRGLM